MKESQGRKLHAQAANAREKGHFYKSLGYNDKALVAYDSANDSLGFAEGIACRSITLRDFANLHGSRRFLILAKSEMVGSVQIARESHDKTALALPLYNLAQLQEDLGELPDAITSYREAIDTMQTHPPMMHDRPAILANMKVHMATCEYKAGDKSALMRALEALDELQQAQEPSRFNKDVWVSGGYMRLFVILKQDNPIQAREYLDRAKEIIDANPELILRRQQWEQLAKGVDD